MWSEERVREGRQDAAVLCYCCAIAFLEVSEFYQLPHGVIRPQYVYRKEGYVKESCHF
jgi:hypothetical protein